MSVMVDTEILMNLLWGVGDNGVSLRAGNGREHMTMRVGMES